MSYHEGYDLSNEYLHVPPSLAKCMDLLDEKYQCSDALTFVLLGNHINQIFVTQLYEKGSVHRVFHIEL